MADGLWRIVWKPYKFQINRFQIGIWNVEFEITSELYAEDDPDLWTTCAKARETF